MSANTLETSRTIRQYILKNFLFTDDDSALSDEDSFLEQGIIDSTGALELANFIEEMFAIKVEDDEMLPENLDSINNLIGFVLRKQLENGKLFAMTTLSA